MMKNLSSMKFTLFPMMVFLAMLLCDAFNVENEKSYIKKKTIPLKSIKSPDGDLIDCIHIYQQPAFAHPLLKNHTIQLIPSYYPEGISTGNNNGHISQMWQSKGSCPEGTIPILRTTKDDLYGKKQPRSFPRVPSSPNAQLNASAPHEHAIAYVNNTKYHGSKATINVWNPQVANAGEFSLAQIWVFAGPADNVNSVEAGWQVFPGLYNDKQTRLFIYWTNDGYKSGGCYNLLCAGFVQTYPNFVIGGAFTPISTYHGPQYDVTMMIWKDSAKNAWWLSVQNITIGYWPASLFTYLADSASGIEWGGEVLNSKPGGQHTTTQMGSGHFPGEGFRGASFFKQLQVIDESNKLVPPGDGIITKVEAKGCYNITLFKNDVAGYNFLFGGPGRNPDCP